MLFSVTEIVIFIEELLLESRKISILFLLTREFSSTSFKGALCSFM